MGRSASSARSCRSASPSCPGRARRETTWMRASARRWAIRNVSGTRRAPLGTVRGCRSLKVAIFSTMGVSCKLSNCQTVNAPTAAAAVERCLATTLASSATFPRRPSRAARPARGPGGRHAKGGKNGGLPLLVVVKHAFPRHRAGEDVCSLSKLIQTPPRQARRVWNMHRKQGQIRSMTQFTTFREPLAAHGVCRIHRTAEPVLLPARQS